jgi:hypothetical protein
MAPGRPARSRCPISPPPQVIALLALLVLLAGCGSGQAPVSERGQARCRSRGAEAANGFARHQAYRRCLASIEAELAEEARTAARLQAAASARKNQAVQTVQRCRNRRQQILALLASLRRTEAELAATKRETYPSMPAPPPWDETRESRYRLEDQELDRHRHEDAVAAWQRREAAGRAAWETGRGQRQDQAQERLNQTARQLRQLEPALLSGPGSIEVDPAVARRLRSCEPGELAAGSSGP